MKWQVANTTFGKGMIGECDLHCYGFFSVMIEVLFLVKAFRDLIRFAILVMWVEYDHGILLNLLKFSSVMLSIRDFQLEVFVFKFTFRQMNFRSSVYEVIAFITPSDQLIDRGITQSASLT